MPDVPEAQHSAGGVVLDRGRALLIRTRTQRGRTVWTFPKGRSEPGEAWPETALREVLEETGYACRIRIPLKQTSYQFFIGGTRVSKTVHWFLMEPVRKSRRRSLREVDEARWVPVREAYTKLSYASDRRLLALVEATRKQQGLKPPGTAKPRPPGKPSAAGRSNGHGDAG